MTEPSSESHEPEESDAEDEASPSVGAMPDADEVDTEAIDADRAERLDPDNRPDNVEVDNTPREFDSEKGMFTDSEGYDEAEATFDDDAF